MAILSRACRLARLIAGLLLVSSLAPLAMPPALGQQPTDSASRKNVPDGDKSGNKNSGASGRPRLHTLDKQRTVRVALTTDVSSCSVGCPSGLVIQSSDTRGIKTISGPLRIELRSQPDSEALNPPRSRRETPAVSTYDAGEIVYRIRVASYRDSAHANKLVAELRKKFYEPTSVISDSEESKYDVFIGRFRKKSDADDLAARLRRDGYPDPRVERETLGEDDIKPAAPPSTIDDNSKLAKRQSQSAQSVTARPPSLHSGNHQRMRMVVLESGRVIASTSGELTIAAAGKSMEERGAKPSSSVDEGNLNS